MANVYNMVTGNYEVRDLLADGSPLPGFTTTPPVKTYPDAKRTDYLDSLGEIPSDMLEGDILSIHHTSTYRYSVYQKQENSMPLIISFLPEADCEPFIHTIPTTRPSEKTAPAGRFYCGKTKKIAPQDTYDRYIDEINGNIQVMGGNLFKDNGWNT